MTEPQIRLYLAPAASGKTAHVLDLARAAARELGAIPRIVVSTQLQVRALRRRLAEQGGGIGVRLLTFDLLHAECLIAAGEAYTELSEPVQFRLIRSVVDEVHLDHYAPLVSKPGFVPVLEGLIAELKAARVDPEAFAAAVQALGDEPRLRELAAIYSAYQARLQDRGWADRAGLAWLALEALEQRAPEVARDWPLLLVDGFDSFTPVQLALLQVLSRRADRTVFALTGSAGGSDRPWVHQRFHRTRALLEAALGVTASPLPERLERNAPVLAHLEAGLFRSGAGQVEAESGLDLIEAPDRAAEVRAALRWLKARLVEDGLRPGEVALLARAVRPYRPFILQTAAEFRLPVRLVGGLPLRTNSAVVALLDLLSLVLGTAGPLQDPGRDDAGPALVRRQVVEAWRSPYFDWSALPEEGAAEPIGIEPGDADLLDAAARQGRVIGGLSQWEQALDMLVRRAELEPGSGGEQRFQDDGQGGSSAVLGNPQPAIALRLKFQRFVQRLTPPAGLHRYRHFVRWLEQIIGPDPGSGARGFPSPEEPTSLRLVQCILDCGDTAERDIAALRAVKDVLRGLVWAEEALGSSAGVDFARFYDELAGAVDAASYLLPVDPHHEEIVVAALLRARGVPFRAVAVLGLAEGEFPAVLGEDPFLRDADRLRLREEYGLPLEPSIESAEAQFFYETVTRPRDRLLLTRPRLADSGSPWQPSPYWEEVRRLVRAEPLTLASGSLPPPGRAASWAELFESLAAHPGHDSVRDWVRHARPADQAALEMARQIVFLRVAAAPGAFDGDLTGSAAEFASRFAPTCTWSASRLETYRACPFSFFVRHVLGLEPREEPVEGLDARQLGNIYHHILERVYQAPEVDDPLSQDQLLAALPVVADAVLDAAPEREGFRETAWWTHTRQEIVQNVARSLEALAQLPGLFVPHGYEAAFGLRGQPELVVYEGDDFFQLRGFIDRVDRAPDGNAIRVIDYKTAGPWSYGPAAVVRGEKLQLPLYALAARDALGLGEPVEGFYWHVQHAEPSPFALSRFEGGPEAAIELAVEKAWEAVHSARDGHFVPAPPPAGCPAYCPAAGFCWHLRPAFWG